MQSLNTLFVGIDIALEKFDVTHMDMDSNILTNKKNRSFPNNPVGVSRFIDETLLIAKKHNFNSIKIGFEATNNYAFHLSFYLQNDKRLKNYNLKIYQLNPKLTKNARKSYSEIPKNDFFDSYVISERLKNGKLIPHNNRLDSNYLALRFITRERFRLVKKLVSTKLRFISILFIKASSFVQTKIFSNIFSATFINLISEFEMKNIIEMDMAQLVDFILKKSKNKIKWPEKVAERIKILAQECYSVDNVILDSVDKSLSILLEQINFYKNQLKNFDKLILEKITLFKKDYEILTSIKGIGLVFASGIISELGNIANFNNQAQVAKFCGIIWRIRQSGKFKSEETELAKTGNKYLRYYLIEAAQSLVKNNPDFLSYYNKKHAESSKHRHMRAIVMVARKLVRVIFSLLKNKKTYQSPKLIKLSRT